MVQDFPTTHSLQKHCWELYGEKIINHFLWQKGQDHLLYPNQHSPKMPCMGEDQQESTKPLVTSPHNGKEGQDNQLGDAKQEGTTRSKQTNTQGNRSNLRTKSQGTQSIPNASWTSWKSTKQSINDGDLHPPNLTTQPHQEGHLCQHLTHHGTLEPQDSCRINKHQRWQCPEVGTIDPGPEQHGRPLTTLSKSDLGRPTGRCPTHHPTTNSPMPHHQNPKVVNEYIWVLKNVLLNQGTLVQLSQLEAKCNLNGHITGALTHKLEQLNLQITQPML